MGRVGARVGARLRARVGDKSRGRGSGAKQNIPRNLLFNIPFPMNVVFYNLASDFEIPHLQDRDKIDNKSLNVHIKATIKS